MIKFLRIYLLVVRLLVVGILGAQAQNSTINTRQGRVICARIPFVLTGEAITAAGSFIINDITNCQSSDLITVSNLRGVSLVTVVSPINMNCYTICASTQLSASLI